jgi:hypothetical protein
MRWSFKKMWALMIVFAMFSIAFVGVATNDQDDAAGTWDEPLSEITNERTRGPGVPRVVLLERFTNTGCVPCVYASENEDVFTDDHSAENLAVLKYHVSWPDGVDPMYLNNPSVQQTRWTYYGVSGVPHVKIDGSSQPTYPYTYDAYHQLWAARAAMESPFALSVEGILGVTTATVYVNVTAVDVVPGGSLKVRVALYLNNVDYPSNPGSNGETHFEFVFLDFIPDINGRDLTISQGQTVNFVETFTIPTEIPAGGGDPAIPLQRSQFGVVSFIQDQGSREVHQAGVLSFADLIVVPTGIMTTPLNPNLGDMVGISARFENKGEDISNAYVTAYIDQVGGDPIGPALATGPMITGQVKFMGLGQWDTTGQPGLRTVYVKVDVQNDYWESSEYNNVAMKEVNVASQFDVGVSQINPFTDAMTYPMSNYSLEGAIKNYGQNSLGDFDVEVEMVQLGPPNVPVQTFFDDFEGGIGDWTVDSLTSNWMYGIPSGAPGAHSGANVWGTALMGNYLAFAYDWLMSPTVDVPSSTSSVTLNFWHFYTFQASGGDWQDCSTLWISTDDGISWILMDHFRANNGAWSLATYDLSAYAGQSVRLAFQFISDRSGGALGWYIDDVEIVSMLPTETPIWNSIVRMSTILAPGASDIVNWNHKILSGGTHKLYVWTPLGGDQNPANDMMSVTFDIDPTKWRNSVSPIGTLVSSPLLLTEANIGNIVAPSAPGLTSVRSFDALTGTWSGYDPAKPVNSLTTVDHKMGMWVVSNADTYIDFSGTIPGVTVDIQLEMGWNLVGYPSMTDRTVADALSGVTYDRIEGYDTGAPYHLREMSGNDWMTSGQGYWIYVSSIQTWSVDA